MENSKMSDYTAPGEGKWQFTGYHMVASMVAFFGVIMIANFTMAWFASSSWSGLVVKNSYVASQNFNERLKAARVQDARGWEEAFSYGERQVEFGLLDSAGKAVDFDMVSIKFFRPVSQNRDIELMLTRERAGQYQANIALAPGVWLFKLIGKGADPYRLNGRMIVDEAGKGFLQ